MDGLLQVLRVKGRATPTALASALLVDSTGADFSDTSDTSDSSDITARLAELEAAGLVETTRHGYRVTELGRERADELYEQERTVAGSVAEQVYGAFEPLDGQVKQIVTDWQLRPVGGSLATNDHDDPHYDQQVLARLRRTDAEASTALAPLTGALTRLGVYPRRLQRALDLADQGDHSMVASPAKDSYHTVWFELHEELLILTGRPRTT